MKLAFKKPFKPFHATGLFLYTLKISENLWIPDVFRGYRKRPVAWNGLKQVKQLTRFNYFSIQLYHKNQKSLFSSAW